MELGEWLSYLRSRAWRDAAARALFTACELLGRLGLGLRPLPTQPFTPLGQPQLPFTR